MQAGNSWLMEVCAVQVGRLAKILIGSATVALFVTLMAVGLALTGYIGMGLARLFFVLAWIVAVVGTAVRSGPKKHTAGITLIAAIVIGAVLLFLDHTTATARAQQDAASHPQSSGQPSAPAPAQSEQHGKGSGSVGGSITTGPCSNVQVGGNGNQASVNCGALSRVTVGKKADKFKAALVGTQGMVFIFPDGTDQDVVPLAKQLCDFFSASWAVNCVGVPGYHTEITIKLPTELIGLHCYLADDVIRKAFKDSGLQCIYEDGPFKGANGISFGAPTILVGNAKK